MEKMVEIVCTMEQLETIKTALMLESERYHENTNENKLLKSAREAVNNWKWRK